MRLAYLFPTLNSRLPQNEKKVPFRQRYPLKLQNMVTGGQKLGKEQNCLFEMSLLFTCLSENNFEESLCHKQIDVFQRCCANYDKFRKHQRELQKVAVPSHDTKNFTNKQLTYLLRKYPTI